MALNKLALESGILQLLKDMKTKEQDSDQEFASGLATLIDSYVRSGSVQVSPGILVTTAGTAAAQSGATTTVGTGTIN